MASIFPGLERERGCCSAKGVRNDLIELSNVQNPTYGVSATYYKLGPNLTTTLMLNNKGPEPIMAMPRIYSLSGTQLDLAPISVPATSYLDVDMNVLLAAAGPDFREGSLKINYQGGDYQLGAQVKMVNEQNGLIWAEQLVYTSKFVSNKLESVWWLPSENVETRLVVSNTSYSSVTVTLSVDGTTPHQSAPVQITLARNETRVLDIMADLVGEPYGTLHNKGGVSISHTGNPGAVLARMFVAKPSRGYSASLPFIDPENTASQRWHGNGFRFRNVNGAKLESGIAVRNVGTTVSRVKGKIIYTQPNGDVSLIHLPERQIPGGSTRTFNLGTIIDNASVPASVKTGGIEIEYDTLKGSIITLVQSGSSNGEHIFHVPIFDPQKMPSSAGGFPWKADGDFTTLVYLKNETDSPKKYTAHLAYAGGGYTLGIRELKAHETVTIDFRDLRDSRTPGNRGELIPLNIDSGQIAWSAHGIESKVMSGRSEQISLNGGIASTYACYNQCPNVIDEVWIDPPNFQMGFGETAALVGMQTELNSYGQPFGPYTSTSVTWESFDTGVATLGFGGNLDAVGVGATQLQGTWQRTIWINWGGYCEPFTDYRYAQAPVEVVGIQKIQYKGPNNTTFDDVGSTLYVLKNTEVTFKAIPNPTTAPFPSGQPVWSGTSGATGTGQTISLTFSAVSSSTSDFKSVIATAGSSSVTINVVVYDLEKVVTPVDNFEGRSQTSFGLKETIDLNATITPSGVTATQAGGLEWSKVSGGGDVDPEPGSNGIGLFTAPASPGNTTLKLAVVSGPSKDKNLTQELTTVAPTSTARLILSTGRRHTQGVVGAGFKAHIHFDPKNVSFKNIQFSEGACDAFTSGYLAGVGEPHLAGPTDLILLCNITTGCRTLNEDTVYLGHPANPSPTPYSDGLWLWQIPWYYHSGGGPVYYHTAEQLLLTDGSGNATISKGGASVTYNVNDPSINW